MLVVIERCPRFLARGFSRTRLVSWCLMVFIIKRKSLQNPTVLACYSLQSMDPRYSFVSSTGWQLVSIYKSMENLNTLVKMDKYKYFWEIINKLVLNMVIYRRLR